jgi:hypothetical protein
MSELLTNIVERDARCTLFSSALGSVIEKESEVVFHFVIGAHKKPLVLAVPLHTIDSALPMTKEQCPMRLLGGVLSEVNSMAKRFLILRLADTPFTGYRQIQYPSPRHLSNCRSRRPGLSIRLHEFEYGSFAVKAWQEWDQPVCL